MSEGRAAGAASGRRLRDIMSADVVVLTSDTPAGEAAVLLAERGISGAPVIREEQVVGVLSLADLLAPEEAGNGRERPDFSAPAGREAASEGERSDFFIRAWAQRGDDVARRALFLAAPGGPLEGRTAAEFMTPDLHALPPDAELERAAEYMLAHGVHRILVVDRGRLVGVVTTTDMVRAMGGLSRPPRAV